MGMNRSSIVYFQRKSPVIAEPVAQAWLDRAVDFSSSEPEVEDWSFLSTFSQNSDDWKGMLEDNSGPESEAETE